jgi:hypothetical protein
MKVDCKNFKGIEYVQFNELPLTQQEKLLQSPNHNFFIKIMIDGKIVGQCLQYKDYSYWYETVFGNKAVPVKGTRVQEKAVVEMSANLASV